VLGSYKLLLLLWKLLGTRYSSHSLLCRVSFGGPCRTLSLTFTPAILHRGEIRTLALFFSSVFFSLLYLTPNLDIHTTKHTRGDQHGTTNCVVTTLLRWIHRLPQPPRQNFARTLSPLARSLLWYWWRGHTRTHFNVSIIIIFLMPSNRHIIIFQCSSIRNSR